MDISCEVTEDDHAEGDSFDEAAFVVEVDDIADADLIFEEDEEAADDVLDEVLCTESDGEADYTGGGDDGADFEAELFENHHAGDDVDTDAEDPTDDSGKGVGAFLGFCVLFAAGEERGEAGCESAGEA